MGYVQKANFDTDPDSRYSMREYSTQRVENKAVAEREQRAVEAKEASARAYEDWLALKALRDTAVTYLGYVPPPTPPRRGGVSASGGSVSASVQDLVEGLAGDAGWADVLAVGRALKTVDRSLLPEWTAWTSGYLPANYLAALWDCFPPMACDVHCAAYSQVQPYQPTVCSGVYVTGLYADQGHVSQAAAAGAGLCGDLRGVLQQAVGAAAG